MATKTVSLTESAYRKLKRLKEEGESFSDVVERISSEADITRFSGSFPEIAEVKEEIEQERGEISTREVENL